MDYRTSWRRVRDFFGALLCTFASLRSLTPSAKTVHRTVFFRRQFCSLLVRIPLFVLPKQKAGLATCFSFWRRVRVFFRCTPVRLRVASLLVHVGKNSPPDCFLPQTSSAPSLFESLFLFCQSKKQALRPAFHFGGELGIRTLGTLRTQHFECCTFDHSDNSPCFSLLRHARLHIATCIIPNISILVNKNKHQIINFLYVLK